MKEDIPIKSSGEIAIMTKGGKIAAMVLAELKKTIKPGITTKELDKLAEEIIINHNAQCSFKGFGGFPAATCISVNDEVVHGIPSNRIIKDGDLVGIDVGVLWNGFHTDTAITVGVGKISKSAQKLLNVTQKSLDMGIKAVKPGVHLGDIQSIIQKTIEEAGFGVVRDLSGHGVGKNLQEAPSIPNFGKPGLGLIIKEGMTLAIEPMVTAGDWHVRVKPDGWTVATLDGSLSAHFEHSIVITRTGAEVLTK